MLAQPVLFLLLLIPCTSDWMIQLAPNLTFNYAIYPNRFRGRCARITLLLLLGIFDRTHLSFIDQRYVCHISCVDRTECTANMPLKSDISYFKHIVLLKIWNNLILTEYLLYILLYLHNWYDKHTYVLKYILQYKYDLHIYIMLHIYTV